LKLLNQTRQAAFTAISNSLVCLQTFAVQLSSVLCRAVSLPVIFRTRKLTPCVSFLSVQGIRRIWSNCGYMFTSFWASLQSVLMKIALKTLSLTSVDLACISLHPWFFSDTMKKFIYTRQSMDSGVMWG